MNKKLFLIPLFALSACETLSASDAPKITFSKVDGQKVAIFDKKPGMKVIYLDKKSKSAKIFKGGQWVSGQPVLKRLNSPKKKFRHEKIKQHRKEVITSSKQIKGLKPSLKKFENKIVIPVASSAMVAIQINGGEPITLAGGNMRPCKPNESCTLPPGPFPLPFRESFRDLFGQELPLGN